MATIKSFTSLEQSRKLAEILPLESEDYHYIAQGEKSYFYPYSLSSDAVKDYNEEIKCIPCWSLAALLGVLPNDTSLLYFDDTYQMVYDKKPYVISNKFDNPVDACYEMILKLHELKLL